MMRERLQATSCQGLRKCKAERTTQNKASCLSCKHGSLEEAHQPCLTDPLSALAVLVLGCARPAAAWQSPLHACSPSVHLKPRWTPEYCMQNDDAGFEATRRSLLALLSTAGALLGAAGGAWASFFSADGGLPLSMVTDWTGEQIQVVRLPQGYADGYTLPITNITEAVFGKIKAFPETYPFNEKDFSRFNNADDSVYYAKPQFKYGVDAGAIAALTHYYNTTITKSKLNVLDVGSSWVSHYPREFKKKMRNIVGIGLNPLELQINPQLTEFEVRDLNKVPELPFRDASFDVVTCAISIPYFTSPVKIFKEVRRILKPRGRFIVSTTRQCEMAKAVNVWLRFPCLDRLRTVGAYFHYAGGFSKPTAFDITAKGKSSLGVATKDLMWVVEATKL